MMVSPELLPSVMLAHITKCEQCESERRPRVFVCTYHEGYLDGWEAASTEQEEIT